MGRGRKCAAILSYQINLGNILTNAAASSPFTIEVKFPILLHGLLYGDDSAIPVETKKAVKAAISCLISPCVQHLQDLRTSLSD